MRRRALIFLSAVLASLLVIPLTNLLLSPKASTFNWHERKVLYSMDRASAWLARALLPLGISAAPAKVVVGRDGWLYLGDEYSRTISQDRRAQTPADLAQGRQIGDAMRAWDAYLASRGVKLLRIMVGPNKASVYPEHLPDWARPASPNAADALFAGADPVLHVDLRATLRTAKAARTEPLYFVTDTHWNRLGVALGFREFARQAGAGAPALRWPPDEAYQVDRIDARAGGDLAKMLRIAPAVSDLEPALRGPFPVVETTQTDYRTGRIVRQGGNPTVDTGDAPLLVTARGALNTARVLWLRDSFGAGMAPLMASTFSQVLQVQWGEATRAGGDLIRLVDEWKPDYVFFTVVERDAHSAVFATFPPTLIRPADNDFTALRTSAPAGSQHLSDADATGQRRVGGNDPFLDFTLSAPVNPRQARYLVLDVACDGGAAPTPVQVFWLEEGRPGYDEERSMHLLLPPGRQRVDLRTVNGWGSAGTVQRLRVDIDAPDKCALVRMAAPQLSGAGIGLDHGAPTESSVTLPTVAGRRPAARVR